MAKEKLKKKINAAGQSDKIPEIACAEVGINLKEVTMDIGNSTEYDELRKAQGFKESSDGSMSISAQNNKTRIERIANTKIERRERYVVERKNNKCRRKKY